MVFTKDGHDIISQYSDSNDITYPMAWLRSASQDQLNSLGIKVLVEVYPLLEENEYYDGTYVDTETQRIYNVATI